MHLDSPGSTRSRGYLPHREGDNPVYFDTFRLADSLPGELLVQIRKERQILETARPAGAFRAPDRARLEKLRALLRKADRSLDSGLGECHMRDPRVAQVVADAIRCFDGERYRLLAWCVMPNHAHAVLSPLGEHKLEAILHSWKSFSALQANRLLGRTGRFWQREYFDHRVRNQASFEKIIRYVRENPRRAGPRDWPWVSA